MANLSLSGNLHFKPLSAHLTRAVYGAAMFTGNLVSERDESTWQGRATDLLSNATMIVGGFAILPLALIEMVASLSLGLVGLGMNALFFSNTSEFLQKRSLRCISFAIHSGATAIINLIMGLKQPKFRYNILQAVVDHGIHLVSAGYTQLVFGSKIDQLAGREGDLAFPRIIHLFRDSHPQLLQDIAAQLERDFGIRLMDQMGEIPSFDEYLRNHPELRDFIEHFDFTRVADGEYRRILLRHFGTFLREFRLIRVEGVALRENEDRFPLNQVSEPEKRYQDYLCNTIRDTLLEVHRAPELSSYLNGEDETPGKDRIEMIDGAIIQPLLTFAQYTEVLGPIECPREFTTPSLLRFNERREKIRLAALSLGNLNEEEKRELKQKILKGADYEARAAVQNVFLQLRELSSDFERGPLLSRTYVNIGERDDGNLIETTLLYQKAWREALAELNN